MHTDIKASIPHDIITKARRAQEAIQIEKKKNPKALSENKIENLLTNQEPIFTLKQYIPNLKSS